MARTRLWAINLLAATLLASCANAPPEEIRSDDTASGDGTDPAIVAACGGVRFPTLPPDPSVFAPFDDWASVDLSEIGMEGEFFDRYDWFVAEESSATLELFGQPRSDPDGDLHASAGFERESGAWLPTGWGDCRIELSADGWGNARFELDPSVPLDPASSTISVLATEVDCASGQPPDGRDVRAIVLGEDAKTVSVVIVVEPVHGAATCQSNPAFPFQVDLGSPLGDRHVLDASVYPAVDVAASASTGNTPDVPSTLEMTCEADGSTTVATPRVAVRPDGFSLKVRSDLDEPASLNGLSQDIEPGVTELVLTTAPGRLEVACWPFSQHGSGTEPPTVPVEVMDPQGLYVSPELECDGRFAWGQTNDFIDTSTGQYDDAESAARAFISNEEATDVFAQAGYPEQVGGGPMILVRDGRTIASIGVGQADDGRWYVSGADGCDEVATKG